MEKIGYDRIVFDMVKRFLVSILLFFRLPELVDWTSRVFFEGGHEKVIVLLYHRVAIVKESWELPAVPPIEFEKQLVYLKRYYHVISLATFVDALKNGFDRLPKKHGRRFVVITFDDGFKDNFTNAFPLLKKYETPATFYISTGFIENPQMQSTAYSDMGRHEFLSWRELQEMANHPLVEIGAHTVSHPRLTDISVEDAMEEIRISKSILEEKLGKTIAIFAYPFGTRMDYSNEIVDRVKGMKFESATTVVYGMNDTKTDPYEIKRVVAGFDFLSFRARLSVLHGLWNDCSKRIKQSV